MFYKRYLNLKILDKDGSTIVFDDLVTPQGKNVDPYWQMTQAANGNIVIFWSHLEQEIGTVDWDMQGIVTVSTTHYISTLDQSGELINQITVPSSDAPHGPGSLLALEDGGFVFVELQETNYESVDGSSYDPTQRLILHAYNADGTARREKIIFAEFDDSDLTTFEIESLQNGGFAVSFSFDEWLDGAHGAQRLYTVRFTADGKIIYPTLSNEGDWGTYSSDDDRIDTFAGDDYAAGGDGGDTLIGREGDDTLDGEEGNDVVAGGTGNDSLIGGAGNDSISGSFGHDTISGNDGDDRIGGGYGEDDIHGDAGNDTIGSGIGDDYVHGDEGDDVVAAGDGDDFVFGGEGNDRISGSVGNDILQSEGGNDNIGGGYGHDIITAGAGDDTVGGGQQNDEIHGDAGNDILNGNNGDDTIYGGPGDDTIQGGDHNDLMWGHEGADVFKFRVFNSGTRDYIVDFTPGEDKIEMPGNFESLRIYVNEAGVIEINKNGHTIVLQDIAGLTEDDFIFV